MKFNNLLKFLCLAIGIIVTLINCIYIGFHPNTDQIYQSNWISTSANSFFNFDFKDNYIFNYLLGLYGNFTYFFMTTLFLILTPFALIIDNFNFYYYSIFIYLVNIGLIYILTKFYISTYEEEIKVHYKDKIIMTLFLLLSFYFSYHFFFYKISAGHHILGVFFLYNLIFYFNKQFKEKKIIIINESYKFYLLYILTIFSNYTNVLILFIFFSLYLSIEIYKNKKIIFNKSRLIFLLLNVLIIILTLIVIFFYSKYRPGQVGFIFSQYGSISSSYLNNIIITLKEHFFNIVNLLFDGYGFITFISFIWLFKDKKNFILRVFFLSFCVLFIFYPSFISAHQRTIIYFIPIMIIFSFMFLNKMLFNNFISKILIYLFLSLNLCWASYPIVTKDSQIRNLNFFKFSTGSIGNTFKCINEINIKIKNDKVIFLENNIRDVFKNVNNNELNYINVTSRLTHDRIVTNNDINNYFQFFNIEYRDIKEIKFYITRGNDINGYFKENKSENLLLLTNILNYFNINNKNYELIHTCHTNERSYDLIYLFKVY